MILLIDNYDSFSYNLVQLVGEMNPDIQVIRNDELTVEQIEELHPSHIILSPGPGYPKDAGVCEEVVQKLKGKIPILGVCLGHQGICEVFGTKICHAKQLMHGKKSNVKIDTTDEIFKGLPEHIDVARYHSLIADMETIPEELKVISVDANNEVMAVRHREYLIYGLQFHPESILTPDGKTMMRNFLNLSEKSPVS
jgi:anthranilate synthase/aminodeoxychorismate synthase-like glutamine amidotransferase